MFKEEWSFWRIYWNFALYSLGLVLLAMALEVFFLGLAPSTLGTILKRDYSSSLKLDFFLFFGILLNIFRPFEVIFFLGPYLLKRKLSFYFPVLSMAQWDLPFWSVLKYPSYFLLREFFDYWMHRMQHQVKALWEFHQLHHSAKELNVVTLFRVHPGDGLVSLFFRTLPLAFLGFRLEEALLFVLFEQFIHFLQHTRLPWHWGPFGKYLIHPPLAHRLHHARERQFHDKNYGSITPLFDHLFGTWGGEVITLQELGLIHDPYEGKSWAHKLLIPVKNFYLCLLGSPR